MDAVILSNALDTNGQNGRYHAASEKYGSDPVVIDALAIGKVDIAGVVNRFAIASEKFDNLRIRSVHRADYPFFDYPDDIRWHHGNQREIQQMAMDADVLHLNNSPVSLRRLRIGYRTKPVLLHHHGSLFRNNPKYLLDEARHMAAIQCVSTVDLMKVAPHILHWAPTAYDVDWLQAFGREHRTEHDTIRIVQCPTDGGTKTQTFYKSTTALVAAVEKAKAEGANVELVVVQDRPWLEALAIKASADIYFDQVKLGYGCNAVEAWGMGIPVIAGADPWTLAKMREVYGTDTLPFYEATEDTIADAILALCNKATRTKYAKRGMAHIRKFHDELPALTRLAELYRMAILEPEQGNVVIDYPPVTFRALIPQIRIGGKYITFSDGDVVVDNPAIATRLRLMAQRYPKYGIEEVA